MRKFKKGDKVRLYSYALSGKRFLEGVATVDGEANFADGFYYIKFEDGSRVIRNLADAEIIK